MRPPYVTEEQFSFWQEARICMGRKAKRFYVCWGQKEITSRDGDEMFTSLDLQPSEQGEILSWVKRNTNSREFRLGC